MKTKLSRLLCLIMALAMVLALTACGTTGGSSAKSQNPSSASEPEKTPEAEPQETPDAESEETEEPDKIGPHDYALPLTTEEVVYTATVPVNPNATQYFSDMNENLTWKEIFSRTGVTIEFDSLPGNMIGTQYGIIIAGGEYPDAMCNLSSNYSGGASGALADGVIIDLMDYVEDYMPNYWNFLNQDEDTLKTVKTDNGELLIIPNCYDEGGNPSSDGVVFRRDWFEALDLQLPETYDEYHDVLSAIKNEYGGSMWFMPCGDSRYGEWSAGFGVCGFYATMPTAAYPLIVKDGKVIWGTAMDEYKDYLTMMNQWYSEGLILENFYTLQGWSITESDMAQYSVSAFPTFASSVGTQLAVAETEGYDFVAAKFPVKTAGETHHIAGDTGKVIRTNTTWCFTTNSDSPELLLQVFDYRFSDEGYFLCNWGIEGVTYEMVDGQPEYTELITNNPEGMSVQCAQAAYLTDVAAYPQIGTAFDKTTYTDWALEVRDGIWKENRDNAWALPDTVSLDTQETATVSSLVGDLMTLIQENVVRFITGDLSLDELDTFMQQQEDMGVRTIEECYQAAYDRYLSR